MECSLGSEIAADELFDFRTEIFKDKNIKKKVLTISGNSDSIYKLSRERNSG